MSDDLKTLLRDRLDDVNPDLHAIHAAAVRQGTRIRRVRRGAATLGAAAAVAAVTIGASQLIGGTQQVSDPGFAAMPGGTARVHVGDVIAIPGGATARVTEHLASAKHNRYQVMVSGNPRQIAAFKRTGDAWLRQQYPLDRLVVSSDVPAVPTGQKSPTPPQTQRGPVDLPGWNCQWFPVDDKGACTARNGALLSVNWRPAAEHADYLDPAKADVMPGVHTYVSDVHGHLFVTIAPGQGTTQSDVDAAAGALVWRH